MASMWKPLLAATLAVGRNTRLLTVGSSILAMNAPMVVSKVPRLNSREKQVVKKMRGRRISFRDHSKVHQLQNQTPWFEPSPLDVSLDEPWDRTRSPYTPRAVLSPPAVWCGHLKFKCPTGWPRPHGPEWAVLWVDNCLHTSASWEGLRERQRLHEVL